MKKKAPQKIITYMDLISGKKLPKRGFYIISGSDPFTFSQMEKLFIKTFLSDDPSLFNLSKFSCSANTKANDIVNACMEFPFGSQYKLIIISNGQKLKDEEGKKLKDYLSSPSPSTVTVIFEDEDEIKSMGSGKFNPSKSLKKELENYGLHILCKMDGRQVKDWIRNRFEEQHKEIDSSALNLMVESIGTELWDLKQEAEKLILYTGYRKQIHVKDVEEIVSHKPQSKIFNFTERVGNQDITGTLKILDELIRDKTPEVMIITSLNNHFLFLYRIRKLMDLGESSDSIAKKLRRHPFYVKKSMSQASKFSEKSIENVLDMLARADGALKSGMRERHVIEMTLIQICKQKG